MTEAMLPGGEQGVVLSHCICRKAASPQEVGSISKMSKGEFCYNQHESETLLLP